ncbi:coatomer WD associated domain-containing protein [Hirsutella rhossiliensis]|uniref:Beta'-coat protein n=1 Tax=Hirsutella rhossiliensis TaxID=111463 RepID=A0A9P8ML14_9HYPO|nr:coatomer WD associated domain-containing protein [Hirsutella rhossiliensis]KAH0956947.1 coatomer WD associated domain-containing protein [Hirsutella rhossiliensis]
MDSHDLYSGHAYIWSYETQQIVKTFELTDVPVRAGRFVSRKNWIVCGSDDFQLRVYNYNTSEKITSFEAHPDYIRAIAVHPTLPFILTASDDMTIKLWDWDKGWKCVQVYEGHSHYVMGLAINPKDTNTFASACLDRTVKIWSLGSATANFTLEAHETKGVNHVDYYPHSDKPYLLTTSDDRTIKVWDYTTKSLIATLEGHTNNVSFACYHPELPVIISGSEDGTIRVWHANTYRFEQSLNYSLERAWCIAYQKGQQGVAVGFDDGAVVVKLGREEPAVSMDASENSSGPDTTKLCPPSSRRQMPASRTMSQSASHKDLGTCEVYPQTLLHSQRPLRRCAFGSALDFVWASKENSNDFAIRESPMSVKVYKNFIEKSGGLDVGFQAEGLTGGVLLGVIGQGGVSFFDWATGGLVRRIEVEPKQVYWSDSVQAGQVNEDGVEAAFEVITDISESVRTGEWVGDCFIYTNSTNRLNYLVGDQTYTVSHFDKPIYVLGYIQRDSRIYLADKDVNVTSFALSLPVLEYQTLILEGQGHKELALRWRQTRSTSSTSLGLNQLDIALDLARKADADHKWKTRCFSRKHKPSLAASIVKDWKESLDKGKKGRVAKLIGVPDEDAELFPEWDAWLQAEREGGDALDKTNVAGANGEAPVAEKQAPAVDAEEEEEEDGGARQGGRGERGG